MEYMNRQKSTFRISFYVRRTRPNKHGEVPVCVRITVNGQRADTTIRKSILPDQWDAIRGQASPRTTLGKAINLYIDTVRARIIRIHRDLEMDEQPFTAQQVLDLYLGRKTTNRHTLFELFREHNDKCHQLVGIDLAAATAERYETCMKLTQEFMRHTYHRDDLYLDEVDRRFVEEFEFYLKTHRGCCHNTATKYLKNFKKITRIALAREWMQRDPFAEIRFSLQPVKREMPEKAEIERLMHKEIDIPRLAQTRDLFIFCCFTGLAFSDIKQLAPEHIVTDMQGHRWIRKPRQKTGNMCNIPLLEIPARILQRYRTDPECVAHNVLLPVSSNQKMNAYLKELADICGIRKQLTTHCARHFFATYTLANGVSIESVAKMLGHSDTKMTRHYAKVLDQTILREMNARRPVMPTAMESVFTGSITIDGERVTVRRTAGGEVWLTQLEIARLFGVFEAAVRANIRAIYRSEALRRGRTLRIVHGVELYSLEMIAALAFRLRSLESEAFRRWLLRPAGPEIRLVAIAGEEPVC